MLEKVNILAPILDFAVKQKPNQWPTYDGKLLDRTQYVTSSEIGRCAREIWFSKNLPLVEGKFRWGFAERGHGHEAWIVGKLNTVDSGYNWSYLGDEQVSFHHGYQSGTPDGMFSDAKGSYLVEFKSIDPRSKVSALPKPEHIKQCVQNMDLLETCLDIDVDGGLLVYSNASDFSLTYEYWIDANSPEVGEMMVALERRAEAIMTAQRAEDVEPEGLFTGGCKTCAFGAQCSAAVVAAKTEKNRYDQIASKSTGIFG